MTMIEYDNFEPAIDNAFRATGLQTVLGIRSARATWAKIESLNELSIGGVRINDCEPQTRLDAKRDVYDLFGAVWDRDMEGIDPEPEPQKTNLRPTEGATAQMITSTFVLTNIATGAKNEININAPTANDAIVQFSYIAQSLGFAIIPPDCGRMALWKNYVAEFYVDILNPQPANTTADNFLDDVLTIIGACREGWRIVAVGGGDENYTEVVLSTGGFGGGSVAITIDNAGGLGWRGLIANPNDGGQPAPAIYGTNPQTFANAIIEFVEPLAIAA